MTKIFKYELVGDTGTQFDIEMPQGARILSFQYQNETPFIWAMIQEDLPKVKRRLGIVGTGWELGDWMITKYVGTAQHGPFVWHLFDLGDFNL